MCVCPDIHIDNINLTLAGRELLIDASLSLNWGNRCGIGGGGGGRIECFELCHYHQPRTVPSCCARGVNAPCPFVPLGCARYGLLGTNGCGKSLLMGVLGRRLLPIPDNIDTFHVTHEVRLWRRQCVVCVRVWTCVVVGLSVFESVCFRVPSTYPD